MVPRSVVIFALACLFLTPPVAAGSSPTFAFSVDGRTARFVPSVEARSYFWEFGDGATSGERAPNHTYAAGWVGSGYWVKLTFCNGICETESQYVTVVRWDVIGVLFGLVLFTVALAGLAKRRKAHA